MSKTMFATILCVLFEQAAVAGVFTGVAIAPDGLNAWVTDSANGEAVVVHTSDFGATWQACSVNTNRPLSDVCFVDSLNGWACGTAGNVHHTTDGGLTWTRQNLGGPKWTTRVRFRDSNSGWVVGAFGVHLRTDSRGDSWQMAWMPYPPFPSDTDRFRGVALPTSTDVWLVAGRIANGDTWVHGQGYIAHSSNRGDSWTLVMRDTVFDFYDVGFVDSNNGVVVGGEDSAMSGVVLLTSDRGVNWQLAQAPPGTPFLRGVDFADAMHGWACGNDAAVIRTTDGGLTWSRQFLLPGSNLSDIEFADTLRGIACGDSLVILTTDGGATWSKTLGVAEPEAESRVRGPAGPTMLRGSLRLLVDSKQHTAYRAELLDATGRAVLELRAGANDVRHLSPGVYFVRERSAVSGQQSGPAAVRKVILTR